MNTPTPDWITDQAVWEKIARSLEKTDVLAIDLEGNGYFRYPEHICLIQLALKKQVVLLDPLALKDLSSLGKLLQNPEIVKIFHSCDWDLRSLDRDYGFHVQGLFDSSLAARFLGINEVGLGKVLKHFLGVELDKSKSLQRQDWTVRPLNPESILYASLDVFYLVELRDRIREQLQALGRLGWVEEECARLESLRFSPPMPPAESFWNIKGCRELPPVAWPVLRALNVFRDQLARRLNRPPFKVLSDATLVALAADPAQDLTGVKGLAAVQNSQQQSVLRDLLKTKPLKEGLRFPRSKNNLPPRLSADAKKRFAALKQWRTEKGASLALDPSLLWPMRSLEAMALSPENRQHELQRGPGSEVRAWQVEAFAAELENLFKTKLS